MSRAARPDVAAAAKVVPVLDQIFLPARQGFCGSPMNRVVPEQTSQTLVAAESGVTVPPGPATLIVERPKAVYGATASTFSHGPSRPAAEVGPVAATQITWTALQNLNRVPS